MFGPAAVQAEATALGRLADRIPVAIRCRPRRRARRPRLGAVLAQLVMAFFPVSEADVQRVTCLERPDWRQQAEQTGFDFHTINGEPYWDESAYYAFTLEEIERDIEAPTGELDQMCRDLVARAVSDERILRSLSIPEAYWDLVAASWRRKR